jgi:hypothetical protein
VWLSAGIVHVHLLSRALNGALCLAACVLLCALHTLIVILVRSQMRKYEQ